MKKSTLSLALASSLLLSGAAFANEPTPPVYTTLDPTALNEVTPTFEELDTNRDGQVKQAEIPVDHELNTLFASVDTNGDKALSRSEFDSYLDEDEEEAE